MTCELNSLASASNDSCLVDAPVAMNHLQLDNNFDVVSASTDTCENTKTFFPCEIRPLKNRKPFLWELCPPEIRDLIYDELDREDDWWNKPRFAWDTRGSVPAFIVAVRTLPITYAHALLRFKRLSASIHMDGWNGEHGHQLKDMTDVELKVFEKAEIDLSPIFHRIELPAYGSANTRPIHYTIKRPVSFTSQFLRTNIREVHLRLDEPYRIWKNDPWYFITDFAFWLEGFRGISKLTVELGLTRSIWVLRSGWFFRNIESVLRRAKTRIRVQGRLVTRPEGEMVDVSRREHHVFVELVFESKNGCLMDWSQVVRNIKPNQVARWYKWDWDDGFWGDTSTLLEMLEEGFVIREMDDEYGD